MRFRALGFVGLALAAGLLAGCPTKYLVFSTYTKAGLDIALADGQPARAMFGYKRHEGAIVPVDQCADRTPQDAADVTSELCPDGKETEAMSVYAGLDLENSWINGLHIVQLFATGKSAVNAANDPVTFAELVRTVEKAKEEEEK